MPWAATSWTLWPPTLASFNVRDTPLLEVLERSAVVVEGVLEEVFDDVWLGPEGTWDVEDEGRLVSGLMFTTAEREPLVKAMPKLTATEARDIRARFGTTPFCSGACDQVTVGLDGDLDIDVPAEGDPSFPPVHSCLAAVSPNNATFDGVRGHPWNYRSYAQVTASIYEVLPGDIEGGLWLDAPLHVLLGVASCATSEQ